MANNKDIKSHHRKHHCSSSSSYKTEKSSKRHKNRHHKYHHHMHRHHHDKKRSDEIPSTGGEIEVMDVIAVAPIGVSNGREEDVEAGENLEEGDAFMKAADSDGKSDRIWESLLMKKLKPSNLLDNWRDYFRRGDSDIFGIIDHAIMVAAADWPTKLKSRSDRIAELIFSCKVNRCIVFDYLDLPNVRDEETNHGHRTVETVGVATGDGEDETKQNKNQTVSNHSYGEAEALSDELGEEAIVSVNEVMMIKDILLNKDDEPISVLLESLKKLESMPMNVDILKDTEIGKAVTCLRRHSSDKISKHAKTLFSMSLIFFTASLVS